MRARKATQGKNQVGNWELLCSVGITQNKTPTFALPETSAMRNTHFGASEGTQLRLSASPQDDVTGSRSTGSRICVALTHSTRPLRFWHCGTVLVKVITC